MKKLLIISALFALFFALSVNAEENKAQPPTPLPFHGEIMQFSVGWEFVNAGTATMRFNNKGKNGYRIDTDARTNKFFDMFKKVRDTITSEGIFIKGKPQSTLFVLDQNERNYHAKKRTDFLWKENKVNYTQNDKTDSYKVPAGHLNVMDAFFLTRTLPVKEGEVLKVPVFDSRKRYEIEVRLLRKELVSTPWGKVVECLVIEPKLKSEGIFTSVGTMQVWLTNDEHRIPLKMTAKIKIGRIIARLTGYHPPS
ncbi:MAG TPA: DUF3108 domain-containing protein [Mariprofundaceae bacterium]|nr:DUF3108 domain-containing protein [Mariprofundaceae bacterium]